MNKKYLFKDYTYSQLKGEVMVPTFQRSLVWSSEQKEEFIKSALEGNPFGVILLYDDIQSRKLVIVDGLQRYTTLKKYDQNPFEYIDIKSDDHPQIPTIVYHVLQEYPDSTEQVVEEQLQKIIKESVEEHQGDLKRTNVFTSAVHKKLLSYYPGIKESPVEMYIFSELNDLWRTIENMITIDNLTIPAIIFQGDKSELPNIFEALNTKGTKLSKYEVFASTWSDVLLHAVDSDIAKIIDKRYMKVMEETELSIEGYTEGQIEAQKKITLYEFCFALGHMIKGTRNQAGKYIFGNKGIRDLDAVDSIGFTAANTFLKKHLKDLPYLNKYVNNNVKPSNISKFKSMILKAFKEVEDILYPYIHEYTKYIEAQILSIVYTWFNIHYEIDIQTLEIKEKHYFIEEEIKFKTHMPYRFLFDIINNYWSGTGDTKLFDIIDADLANNRYLQAITENQWRQLLDEWFIGQLSKRMKTITAENKLFYSYFMYGINTVYKDKAYLPCFVIPKYYLEKTNEIISVGNIANLYFLPKEYKTYKNDILNSSKVDINDVDLYPSYDQIYEVMRSDVVDKKTYYDFLTVRFKNMVDQFINNLGVV